MSMRPPILNPLFASVANLPGVGPKFSPLFDRLLTDGGHEARLIDLLFHLPTGAIDRRLRLKLIDAPFDTVVTLEVRVVEHRPAPMSRARAPYKVLCEDGSADLTLAYFNTPPQRIKAMLPIGETVLISGRIEQWDGMRQMTHPDHVLPIAKAAAMPGVEPVYALTEGLGQRIVARTARAALERLPALPEWIDGTYRAHSGFPDFATALRALHAPAGPEDLDPDAPARRRLAYDELLATQLALTLTRAHQRKAGGRVTIGDGRHVAAILARLPFSPTRSQTQALAEIKADLAAPKRMSRLLQGDVGSGKTLVALLAMAIAAEAGRQAALMAPTEILARQHHGRLAEMAEGTGLRLALLTGRDSAAARARTLADLAAGAIDILVGTHALFQAGVVFHDLALAVVDEQHRFGVHERLALRRKGEDVDVLVMTATPIPRTLLLAAFGDMEVSQLVEKPAGRQPIDTRVIALDRLEEVVAGVGRAVASGAQVYWVCPLVEESELIDLAAARQRAEALTAALGPVVGLVHGRMKGPEKDAAMADFVAGRSRVLVATTVIEVGVDVPAASIMVIEHAERFGLAQLHQLRGRVGRGAARSSCLLLFRPPLGETARERLALLRDTEDGFRIAEADLKLRGPGEALGRRQSGAAHFRIARIETDQDLLETARNDARYVEATDPGLTSPRGESLRVLLYLFERDAAVRLLQAG